LRGTRHAERAQGADVELAINQTQAEAQMNSEKCCNSTAKDYCPRGAMQGHSMCKPCYLAYGGFNRRRPSLSRDANDRQKAEANETQV
jgi:hypothetical protein